MNVRLQVTTRPDGVSVIVRWALLYAGRRYATTGINWPGKDWGESRRQFTLMLHTTPNTDINQCWWKWKDHMCLDEPPGARVQSHPSPSWWCTFPYITGVLSSIAVKRAQGRISMSSWLRYAAFLRITFESQCFSFGHTHTHTLLVCRIHSLLVLASSKELIRKVPQRGCIHLSGEFIYNNKLIERYRWYYCKQDSYRNVFAKECLRLASLLKYRCVTKYGVGSEKSTNNS